MQKQHLYSTRKESDGYSKILVRSTTEATLSSGRVGKSDYLELRYKLFMHSKKALNTKWFCLLPNGKKYKP